MNMQNSMDFVARGASRLLTGAYFPLCAMAAGLCYLVFLSAAVYWPGGDGIIGQFATDFRVWCFNYNPDTGAMQWNWVVLMLTQPLLILAIIGWFWREPIAEACRGGMRTLLSPLLSGVAVCVVLGGGLLAVAWADRPETDLPFPGERIRTTLAAPDFELSDHLGRSVRLSDYRGQVVLMTAIYATCGTSCPMLAVRGKIVIEDLPPPLRKQVTMMAVTLDPENDTEALRTRTVNAYALEPDEFLFLNGDPDTVNAVLDRLQVLRRFNEETGQIDHTNLFFLIDANGYIAYRFNLSDRHEHWMAEAVEQLAQESLGLKAEGAALARLAEHEIGG